MGNADNQPRLDTKWLMNPWRATLLCWIFFSLAVVVAVRSLAPVGIENRPPQFAGLIAVLVVAVFARGLLQTGYILQDNEQQLVYWRGIFVPFTSSAIHYADISQVCVGYGAVPGSPRPEYEANARYHVAMKVRDQFLLLRLMNRDYRRAAEFAKMLAHEVGAEFLDLTNEPPQRIDAIIHGDRGLVQSVETLRKRDAAMRRLRNAPLIGGLAGSILGALAAMLEQDPSATEVLATGSAGAVTGTVAGGLLALMKWIEYRCEANKLPSPRRSDYLRAMAFVLLSWAIFWVPLFGFLAASYAVYRAGIVGLPGWIGLLTMAAFFVSSVVTIITVVLVVFSILGIG